MNSTPLAFPFAVQNDQEINRDTLHSLRGASVREEEAGLCKVTGHRSWPCWTLPSSEQIL